MLRQSNTNKVYDHWRRAAAKSHPPSRAEIHPAAIAKALGSTCLLHDPDGDGLHFQLAGSRLCATVGRELTGHAVSTLIARGDQRTLRQGFEAVTRENAIFVTTMTGFTNSGRSTAFESVFMPLVEDSPCILGVIEPLATPLWLGSEPIIRFELDEIRMLDVDRELFCLQNRPSIPMPKRTPSIGASAPARPQLSVIDGHAGGSSKPARAAFRVYEGGRSA